MFVETLEIVHSVATIAVDPPAASRANHTFRTVSDTSLSFAAHHDISLRRCLSALSGAEVPEICGTSCRCTPVCRRDWRGAVRSRRASYWSSWADSLEMILQRHELVCAQNSPHLDSWRRFLPP